MFNVKFNYSLLAPKSQEMANNKNTNSPLVGTVRQNELETGRVVS
jgi:hypothetical protein